MMSASSSKPAPKFRIESIELDTIQKDDKIIVLLGPTGVGKSNFIENLSETELNISSPRLQRGTNDLTLYRIFDHPIWKSNILLADTPGFLDVTLSEYSAIKTIRHWIKSSKAPQLHALFYVDRITNPPKGGDKHCWELFTSLCGESEASRACLLTTAWDDVGKRQAAVEKKRQRLQAYWEVCLSKYSFSLGFLFLAIFV
ncbi:hypothetical protein BJ165DRAFT_1500839 [Panaeolus papilionaceus]|nr:hypothetical protein BJ165DRAFT_1500839 [Panaeolus papilionaceus]